MIAMEEGRVDWHLWNWAQWQLRSREEGLGYPSRASGGMQNYTNCWDTDAAFDNACRRLADATDAVIDELPVRYRQAIHAQHLGAIWMLPAIALALFYREAAGMVGRGLERKGVD